MRKQGSKIKHNRYKTEAKKNYLKTRKLKALFPSLFVCSSFALALEETNISFIYKLLGNKNFYQTGSFQGEKNFLVSNRHQDKFYKKTAKRCHLKKLNSKHEIFIERDKIRNQSIEETLKFFSQSKKIRTTTYKGRFVQRKFFYTILNTVSFFCGIPQDSYS